MPRGRVINEETGPVTFRLENTLIAKLQQVAQDEDRSVSDMARVFLKRALKDIPDAPPSATPPTSQVSAQSVNGASDTAPATPKPVGATAPKG